MRRVLNVIILHLVCLSLTACSAEKKGNPQLLKDVQELVDLGCACTELDCLWKVQVKGQGYAKLRLSAGVKDLKEEERGQFNQALNQWSTCEYDLSKAHASKKLHPKGAVEP